VWHTGETRCGLRLPHVLSLERVELVERALRADMERKVQQIPHSTFGYVQDDELMQGTNELARSIARR
jgi:hypothetical protein